MRERKISIKDRINYCVQIWAGTSQGSMVKMLFAQEIRITIQAVSKCMLKWQEVIEFIQTAPKKT